MRIRGPLLGGASTHAGGLPSHIPVKMMRHEHSLGTVQLQNTVLRFSFEMPLATDIFLKYSPYNSHLTAKSWQQEMEA